MSGSPTVPVFDDEAVAPFKDDVARFVVEACCFVGGDGDHDRSVVLCREGVAEQLDLSSDAFTPMVGSDGNAVSFSYQPCDRLRCVCSTNSQKALVCSMYGLSEAPPTKRFWDHALASVGLRKP